MQVLVLTNYERECLLQWAAIVDREVGLTSDERGIVAALSPD